MIDRGVIWLTGLSGSGKTTIADLLFGYLKEKSAKVINLDGDLLRRGLCSDLGFSPKDRTENIRRAAELSKLLAKQGFIVIASFISPYQSDRKEARAICKPLSFIEVYVATTIEECMRRDPKGLYKRALSGEIEHFTGISAPYEIPQNPEIYVNNSGQSADDAANTVLSYLESL